MPNKTFLQLQTALISMWGYEEVAEVLPQELIDIKSYINAAYFDCFAPVDGTRPWWPEKEHSDIIKAPIVVTLGVTQGSKVVTGHVFEAKYAGSFVVIGDKWFRYAGLNGTDHELIEPWADATGSVSATVYHNAIALPWYLVETAGTPTLLGVGALSPMPDQDMETRLRTEFSIDFSPDVRFWRNRFNTNSWNYCDTGDPRWYFIGQSSVAPAFTLGNRFHVYPIPDKLFTFTVRGATVPVELTENADVPKVPWQTVDNVLLPLAKERLAENTAGRRFTGDVRLIIRAADRARVQLKTLNRTQQNTVRTIKLAKNW